MTIRTSLLGGAVAAALLAPTLAPAATAGAVADVRSGATTQPAAQPRTRVTFAVADCEGCKVQLLNALQTRYTDVHVWSTRVKTVSGGEVSFRVPTKNTSGMSATVRAPWEGQTGYVTTVAWRYNGTVVGDVVTLAEAVTKRRASACWEGVRRRAVTVPLVVAQVEVDGVHGRVPGSIAFVPITQGWVEPMREVSDGVLGSQDINICG